MLLFTSHKSQLPTPQVARKCECSALGSSRPNHNLRPVTCICQENRSAQQLFLSQPHTCQYLCIIFDTGSSTVHSVSSATLQLPLTPIINQSKQTSGIAMMLMHAAMPACQVVCSLHTILDCFLVGESSHPCPLTAKNRRSPATAWQPLPDYYHHFRALTCSAKNGFSPKWKERVKPRSSPVETDTRTSSKQRSTSASRSVMNWPTLLWLAKEFNQNSGMPSSAEATSCKRKRVRMI